MRWHRTPDPRVGDMRTVTRFLFQPLGINHEVRWLERATWVERYRIGKDCHYWAPVAWADSTEGEGREG